MDRTVLMALGVAAIGGGLWYWYDQKKKAEAAVDMDFTQDEVMTTEEPGMGLGTPQPSYTKPSFQVKPGVLQAGQAALRSVSQYYR